MKLFISSTPNIRDHSLRKIFDQMLLLLEKYSFDEIIMFEKTPIKLKEYIFSLCDGIKYDFYVNTIISNGQLQDHISQMRGANFVFIIEHPRVLYSLRRKHWCQKFKKPYSVFSISNTLIEEQIRQLNISPGSYVRVYCQENETKNDEAV